MTSHTATFKINEEVFKVIAIDFGQQLYIWLGDHSNACNDLHCGFPTPHLKDEKATGTVLLGELDSISQDISKLLARKYNKAVFVSINIEEQDFSLLEQIQEKFFQTIFDIWPPPPK